MFQQLRGTNLVGIPIAVKDDDCVGRLQVQAQPTSSGAEKENEVLRSFFVKLLQQRCSVLRLGGSWNTKPQRLKKKKKSQMPPVYLWPRYYYKTPVSDIELK